ncbi:hypothetical protein B14911_09677 [Bacillus sp. NRRL B-14911]|nr:hypothetical protein B14911_09677 [Bacillus sp. NRRL B-14911]
MVPDPTDFKALIMWGQAPIFHRMYLSHLYTLLYVLWFKRELKRPAAVKEVDPHG